MEVHNNFRKPAGLIRTWLAGTGALLFVFSLALAGCTQEVTGDVDATGSTVNINYPQVAAPEVTPTVTDGSGFLILRWKAVENAKSYTVYSQVQGMVKVSPVTFMNIDDNIGIDYDDRYGTVKSNTDPDLYAVLIPLSGFYTTTLKVRYGVQAIPADYWMPNSAEPSNIAWTSNYYDIIRSRWFDLEGTWKKDGASTYPRFDIDTITQSSIGVPWRLSLSFTNTNAASGRFYITENTADVSFEGDYYSFTNGYNHVYFRATLLTNGKLEVSLLNNSTDPDDIVGTYTK